MSIKYTYICDVCGTSFKQKLSGSFWSRDFIISEDTKNIHFFDRVTFRVDIKSNQGAANSKNICDKCATTIIKAAAIKFL